MKVYDLSSGNHGKDRTQGFTRMDLVALILGGALLASLLGSALAASRPASKRELCQTNLKTIGQAYASFAEDHAQRMPWRLTRQEGGTYGEPIAGIAWAQFYMLTNYVDSPRVFACPEGKVKIASTWGRGKDGFLNPLFRGNAISYFVGLDVQANAPKSILSGDANLYVSAGKQACDFAKVQSAASLRPGDPEVNWTRRQHGDPSHILFNDGSVASLSSEALRAALPNTKAFHAENHILMP